MHMRDIFLTPEGKITHRNADFIVHVFVWAIRTRPATFNPCIHSAATKLHEALCRAHLSQGIKRKKLLHILRLGEQLGVLEVKHG